MRARVKYPGKLWTGGQYGDKVNAVFTLEDGEEVKVNASDVSGAKANLLLALRPGQEVVLKKSSMRKEGRKIEYYELDTEQMLLTKMNEREGDRIKAIEKETAKVKYFLELGIEVVRDAIAEKGLEDIQPDTVLSVGADTGSRIHMGVLKSL